ncbi:hypothetical protein P3875_03230 [Myroides sp. JBRI-B21084]|uniref:hypothetical protein n=1 Tax=Myroides sp. JBRI-B21084 TaxID=3119977 RepID=UPI0026E44D6A|nr:hypothetical protein [Paenimyroides cloacae]WKW47087.1 hypothetical protein P3875_03230 [Paenimyroides cloacae]
MNKLFKVIKWLLVVLTILLVAYILGFVMFHDTVFFLNEKYKIYVVFQLMHVAATLAVLFVIWSRQLFDTWKKIDQTLLVVFLSIFGLWFWYLKYSDKYLKSENLDEIN